MTETIRRARPERTLPDIPYLKFGEEVTLTNCDREPIHVPGHAQAHGVVVVLDPDAEGLTVLQASANLDRLCGVSVEDVLGREAAALFGAEQSAFLKHAMADGKLEGNPLYLFTGPIGGRGAFHATAHTFQGVLTVELEPTDEADQAELDRGQADPQAQLRLALPRLRSAPTLAAYCRAVCEAVREISGFDRVMVYRFHEDGHGEVIGEAIGPADTREPYLGLHYPESDIPKQARALFVLNAVRLMPDALYEQAAIIPALNPHTGLPLDMSHCTLRGYSRMYTEYLTNMGSRASMSLAIVLDGALWGLIACHHQSPRRLPYAARVTCEFLADIVSRQIVGKMVEEDADYRARILGVHQRLVQSMVRHDSVLAGLTAAGEGDGVTALSLIEAGGCAVLSANECRLIGDAPPEEEIRALAARLTETLPQDEEVWATDALAAVYPRAEAWTDRAAGLLALRLTTVPPLGEWVLWFRPEAARTVDWGGDPHKPYETGPLGDRLTPRKSFAVWQETVRGRSLPWKTVETEGAGYLRRAAISQIVARWAQELVRLDADMERRVPERTVQLIANSELEAAHSAEAARTAEATRLALEIVDTVREPLLILDTALSVQSVNRAFYRAFQVAPEDTIGRRVYDLGDGQWDIPALRTLLEEIIPENATFDDFEVAHTFPGVGHKTMLLNARRVYSPDNSTELLILAMEDVTERRRAERLVAEIELYAQNIVDTVREPLLMLDPSLRVRSANGAFYQTFRVTAEETEGRLIYELGNGQWDIPALRTLLEEIIPQKSVFNDYELAHDFPAIGWRVMLLNARELRAGSHTEMLVLAMEDVTERRHAEERIQSYMQKLEWSNRELQDFAYIASHDLQEPLRAIQAFGERLNTSVGADLPEDAHDALGRMLRAAARMTGLLHDLLEFSRVTTTDRLFRPVSLGEVAQQAWDDLSKRAQETGGRADIGRLPTVEADATQMRQMLQNLMDNALKYGREGVPPLVTVRGGLTHDAGAKPGRGRAVCRIDVQDNGIGFEEKYAERIFAPFQRLHRRGQYDGTGIGLAICRKIVERHGGRITAQSTPGAGSQFTIFLPVAQDGGNGHEQKA
jgi:light-regulated signal transduction histidine kinase (bacteriophytochrome)